LTYLDNEVLFLQLMYRHHRGGIDMAMYAFNHTTTGLVRQAALAMARDQGEECALMISIMSRLNHPGFHAPSGFATAATTSRRGSTRSPFTHPRSADALIPVPGRDSRIPPG
jgi:uncharacterized protein (DUF305 family)